MEKWSKWETQIHQLVCVWRGLMRWKDWHLGHAKAELLVTIVSLCLLQPTVTQLRPHNWDINQRAPDWLFNNKKKPKPRTQTNQPCSCCLYKNRKARLSCDWSESRQHVSSQVSAHLNGWVEGFERSTLPSHFVRSPAVMWPAPQHPQTWSQRATGHRKRVTFIFQASVKRQ